MNTDEILAALDLPASSRVDRRVPKTLLIANGAPTAADKRTINDGVEELLWVAALKPSTVAVPEFRDNAREYLEIAVLRLTLRPDAKAGRLVELVHRAVPYPVLLVADNGRAHGGAPLLAMAHKRWSQGEAGKMVLEGDVVTVEWDDVSDGPHGAAFRDALTLGRQSRASLYALYQGWMDTVLALEVARRTGVFELPGSTERSAARRAALQECARCEAESARLRAAAAKEKQIPRQVELNLTLKRVEAARAAALARL
ncbi:hypothetical protein MELA_00193 [Candidatus Methylomirabilis lanthanidiphila]|uniref:DUF4391 domain-containing protein n=1 Tax=Candidatus Methylomirabilis lanthanidiphila TaxID=2211376 RepID=A0A564ZEU4_9BACT|nr:DUF4391 domain-containing protein [Candidatus Methylomirabilis lanthanidiphila]VUZ83835.1 hypothetical protein MELA_00193 [Candidatus Methylomirabilis lanthanidiphila]